MQAKNIQAIILAAGQSRRFGSDKTLVRINRIPMSIKIANTLQSINCKVLIVINEKNTMLKTLAKKHNINTLINPCPNNTGIGTSISLAVSNTPNADGWMICLADMPFIQKCTYEKILSAMNNSNDSKIITPTYKAQAGHPVGFTHHFYEQLVNRHGDKGAKEIINKNLNQVNYIDVDDRYIVQDIDTPEDLKLLNNSSS